MTPEYLAFLAGKAPRAHASGIEPSTMPGHMFDFQKAATEFCLRQGRAALFLDTGLGKTICELEFAAQAAIATGKPSLILTPLAVARQIEAEGHRFGYDTHVVREQWHVGGPSIYICNYDRLDKLDPTAFGCVVLDESSILKNFSGKTTRDLIAMFAATPFRLCATATPAPNDHVELGNHAEFLGVMSQSDMLTRWFLNDSNDTGTWRLKGHAIEAFWNWCASWAVMASGPEDLGFDGSRFVLPPLHVHRHRVQADIKPTDGLFGFDVSATEVFGLKRQTAEARADMVANLVTAERDEPWMIWCDIDAEADALSERILDAAEVRGSHSPERKEQAIDAFVTGAARIMISKTRIMGAGLNMQHCARMAFVGRSFSYESWYQAVRRCWRFGQTRPVHVHLIVAEGEDQIGRVIDRKAESHATMKDAMRAASRRALGKTSMVRVVYNPTYEARLPPWLLGD